MQAFEADQPVDASTSAQRKPPEYRRPQTAAAFIESFLPKRKEFAGIAGAKDALNESPTKKQKSAHCYAVVNSFIASMKIPTKI